MGKGFRPTWVLQTPLTPRPPQARSVLQEGLWDAMRKYGEDQPVTEAVDEIQRDVSNGGGPGQAGTVGLTPPDPLGCVSPRPPAVPVLRSQQLHRLVQHREVQGQ